MIQGLLDSTEEYVRELQKKIDQADKEHDHTFALVSNSLFSYVLLSLLPLLSLMHVLSHVFFDWDQQLEADRKIRVAARVQDAVPLLIQGSKNPESNGFFDPLGDSYDDWPVYQRRIDTDNNNLENSLSSSSSPSSSSSAHSTGISPKDNVTTSSAADSSAATTTGDGIMDDIYLFFSADESAWIIQHVHPDKIEPGNHNMFVAFQALQLGHLPFERQGKRYLKFSCASTCFPELRPEGSNGIEEYIYVRRPGVLVSSKTETSCVPTTSVEITTEAEYKMNQEVAALKAERAKQECNA